MTFWSVIKNHEIQNVYWSALLWLASKGFFYSGYKPSWSLLRRCISPVLFYKRRLTVWHWFDWSTKWRKRFNHVTTGGNVTMQDQSEARTVVTVWKWSGKTLSPGALLAVLYFWFTFLREIFFRPFRLFLVPTICPWVSEDVNAREDEISSLNHTYLCNSFSDDLKYFWRASSSISFSRWLRAAWSALLLSWTSCSRISSTSSAIKMQFSIYFG